MNNKQALKNCCGILYGNYPQLIDHIAPFCCINTIPLFATEQDIVSAIEKYYPHTNVHLVSYANFPTITLGFDEIISCHWTCNLKQIYFLAEILLKKEISTIWLPHGMSDKGFNHSLKQLLKDEKKAFVYGSKMKQELFIENEHVSCVGNFRYKYFNEHASFYHQTTQALWKIDKKKKNILFAPTWVDANYKDAFFSACDTLCKELSHDYQLWIKLHPRTEKEYEYHILQLKETYTNCIYLENIPFIYPILQFIDLYIGDYSSIGYDFLLFDRPMIFLEFDPNVAKNNKERALHQCGATLPSANSHLIGHIAQDALCNTSSHLSLIKKNLYQYSYS
ncbi:MAG: CDP-glycerol glycerophosphotransferase family protein [Chlamydiales bacterium]|nr:CDP-glycerol glycerophosphotransferase family protein [Chlamydiales bacterium]